VEAGIVAEKLGLDVESFYELFNLYKATTSRELEETEKALRNADAEKIHKMMHSIKGASINLGFEELFELAKEIDDRAVGNSLEGIESLIQSFHKKYGLLVERFEKCRTAR
jgi:HPt (histidine-containing phosphotransfer) domain-containing protein